ncbi:phosphoribosyltransferase [Desulfurobacterium indicum]|uniref:Phosphoribosyltransferase n=1 Tax=Desulfurobacterium indicum TaxID=1914305 RepID=A0A1R1MM39_9BACT|nr:phosphoribosyltransferase [Desulfurobacterium indicum]
MKDNLFKFLRDCLIDVLSPEYCAVCGKFLIGKHRKIACEECWKIHIKPFSGKRCIICGYPLNLAPGSEPLCRDCFEKKRKFNFSEISYFGLYSGLLEIAIKTFKIGKRHDIGEEIGKTISVHFKNFLSRNRMDFVIPVPLHIEELKTRGFNQCHLILSAANIPFMDGVEKRYHGKKQALLSKEERRKNVKGLFSIKREIISNIRGKRLCIFDDIFTTGSTVNEIAEELIKAGADTIYVYTVARSIKKSK